jgi:hypothetical protein
MCSTISAWRPALVFVTRVSTPPPDSAQMAALLRLCTAARGGGVARKHTTLPLWQQGLPVLQVLWGCRSRLCFQEAGDQYLSAH